jgi:Ser/Thr protein kinase RdoA (MazF antagonist)
VITSSAAATDLGAICRAALGCDVVSSQPLGAGGNSRVFRVELDEASSSRRVIVKFYRRDPGDARDRLGTEFGGLRFLWQNGVRSIPRPLAVVGDRQCAIYECLDGEVAASEPARPADIDAAIDFLCVLKQVRLPPRPASRSAALSPASRAGCAGCAAPTGAMPKRCGHGSTAPLGRSRIA